MVSAVAFAHTLNGFPSPSHHPSFSIVLRGIKRKTFVPPKRAMPMSSETVKSLVLHIVGNDILHDSFYDVSLLDWRTVRSL